MSQFSVDATELAQLAQTVHAQASPTETSASLLVTATGSPEVDEALTTLSQRWKTQTMALAGVTVGLAATLATAANNYIMSDLNSAQGFQHK